MSNNEYTNYLLNADNYSNDSDFEFINNCSDSEETTTAINLSSYEQLTSFQKTKNTSEQNLCFESSASANECNCYDCIGDIVEGVNEHGDNNDEEEEENDEFHSTNNQAAFLNKINFNNQQQKISKFTRNNDKLILNLKETQIHQQRTDSKLIDIYQSKDIQIHQNKQQKERQLSENVLSWRSKSTFKTPFTIVPIDISKASEDRCKTEKTNLPEIVLTSFETAHQNSGARSTPARTKSTENQRKLQKSSTSVSVTKTTSSSRLTKTIASMGLPSEISSTSSSPLIPLNRTRAVSTPPLTQTIIKPAAHIPSMQIIRDQNSPSPELYLDRALSNDSINSSTSLSNKYGEDYTNGIENCNDNCTDSMRDLMLNGISTAIVTATASVNNKPLNLQRAMKCNNRLNSIDNLHCSSSLSANTRTGISNRGLDQLNLHETKEQIPNELKCKICDELYKDPRTLNCLHSFCFQCLINENFIKDISIPFWSRPDHQNFDWTTISNGINNGVKSTNSHLSSPANDSDCPSRPESVSSLTSSASKKSSDKQSKNKSTKSSTTPKKKHSLIQQQTVVEKIAIIICVICKFCTEMPVGGILQLPQNFVLTRKIESLLLKIENNIISNIWCSLCCAEITATYHCLTCAINLCNFCKQAHERQKQTSNHNMKHLLELRKSRTQQKSDFKQNLIKCSLHPEFDLKTFCITCQQIICSDCTILLHKGHKFETINKAFKAYQKVVNDTIDKTKPLCEYTKHSVTKLETISMKINKKCDQVQNDVETFMSAYFEAVETHRKILIQQIAKARETKLQMILEHQYDMEKRAEDAKNAVNFGEDLLETGSEAEILSFVNILLKRFDYCQKFKPLVDPKISDTLHFLPEIRAPTMNAQNNIPLYGIITTQTADPKFCTLEAEEYTCLRVHRKVELVMSSKDSHNVPLCHGGLIINTQLKYKDSTKLVATQVSDRRDGTYVISFTPDSPGTMTLAITIDNKHIKDSPFTMIARTLRPHRGIFHCCTFCSSKGSKTASCACEGTMPGYKGCGHGHSGHPGRRHWSCCGSVLENSECSVANKF